MSRVTGVVLVCDLKEAAMAQVSEFIAQTLGITATLQNTVEASGGNKHPQLECYIAGFNYFQDDQLAAYVGTLDWRNPGNVVLVMQPEEGRTVVWRFSSNGHWRKS